MGQLCGPAVWMASQNGGGRRKWPSVSSEVLPVVQAAAGPEARPRKAPGSFWLNKKPQLGFVTEWNWAQVASSCQSKDSAEVTLWEGHTRHCPQSSVSLNNALNPSLLGESCLNIKADLVTACVGGDISAQARLATWLCIYCVFKNVRKNMSAG